MSPARPFASFWGNGTLTALEPSSPSAIRPQFPLAPLLHPPGHSLQAGLRAWGIAVRGQETFSQPPCHAASLGRGHALEHRVRGGDLPVPRAPVPPHFCSELPLSNLLYPEAAARPGRSARDSACGLPSCSEPQSRGHHCPVPTCQHGARLTSSPGGPHRHGDGPCHREAQGLRSPSRCGASEGHVPPESHGPHGPEVRPAPPYGDLGVPSGFHKSAVTLPESALGPPLVASHPKCSWELGKPSV